MINIDKKKVVISVFSIIIWFAIIYSINLYCLKHGYNYCRKIDGFYNIRPTLNVFICFSSMLLFSSILSSSKFTTWFRFSIIYSIFTVIIVLITPSAGDYFTSDGMDKYYTAFILNAAFIFISLIMFIFLKIKEQKK